MTCKNNIKEAGFNSMFDRLPGHIQKKAREVFREFLREPLNPKLNFHQLQDRKTGQHRLNSWSVRVTRYYRAICTINAATDTHEWYWIGSRSDFATFTGSNN